MKLEPIEDRIVVKPDASIGESAGGLIIPESEREKPQKGTVIAVGDGAIPNSEEKLNFIISILMWMAQAFFLLNPKLKVFEGKEQKVKKMVLKNGDRILFGKLAGSEVVIDGEAQLIMRQSDVLAKIVD